MGYTQSRVSPYEGTLVTSKGHVVPIGGPRRPIEGRAKRAKERQKWEGNEGLRRHGDL